MKIIITLALLAFSVNGFSAEKIFAKSVKPPRVVTAKAGYATSRFSFLSTDFREPRELFNADKKITSVYWQSTYFPENLNERVQICYLQPYRVDPDHCIDIEPNSSGITEEFNSFRFGMGAAITIQHRVSGGKNSSYAAGKDAIVVNYSY